VFSSPPLAAVGKANGHQLLSDYPVARKDSFYSPQVHF